MKLFPKLALIISGLLVGSTLALSLTFYWMERNEVRQRADQERRAVLQNLAHIAQESFLTNDDLLLVKYTGWLQKWNPSLMSASVVSRDGDVLAHSEPGRIGTQKLGEEGAPGEIRVLTEPVRIGAHWIATASVGFSERHFEEVVQGRLQALRRRVAGIVLISVLAGVLIAFILAHSWTKPIQYLAQVAARVGKGKFQQDLSGLTRRRDELGFLSKAFAHMAEQLHELDRMKEDFVSAVTHELRSPLGAIESYLNLINQELPNGISASDWRQYIDRMRLNTQRLTRFVNDLLDVAALERGKVRLSCEAIPLGVLAQDVLTLFAAKLQEKHLTCEVDVPPETPTAWADLEKVRQVLVNLLANAIKFTPEGGSIQIQVQEQAVGQWLRISVKDSGIGISEQDQMKIFSKFEQVLSARQSVKGPKGTGLGLSISRALVELHGGHLEVRSQPGEGSTFFFTLPTTPKTAPVREAATV